MKKQNLILICCCALLVFGAAVLPAAAQKSFSGNWEWKGRPDKNKMQSYFSIQIKPKGTSVSGTLYFNDLVDGEVESDGGAIPYIGTIKGDVLTIEFDPDAAGPAYEENVRYKRPKGKQPATASLRIKNGKLEWTQTRGSLGMGMPRSFLLTRAR